MHWEDVFLASLSSHYINLNLRSWAGEGAGGLQRLLHHQHAALWADLCGAGGQPPRHDPLAQGSCQAAEGTLHSSRESDPVAYKIC